LGNLFCNFVLFYFTINTYGKGKCQGYGFDGLKSYLEYNPKKVKNNCKTNGSPINAVVVTTWRGKAVSPDKLYSL